MKKYYVILIVLMFSITSYAQLADICKLGLTVVCITTDNNEEPTAQDIDAPEGCFGASITNKTSVKGRLEIYDNNGENIYDSGSYAKGKSGITMKLRGNTSGRIRLKPPYKIKLQQKADLLHRGNEIYDDKDWALIHPEGAPYSSPIMPMVGFEAGKLMGLQWTPCYEYVNLILNGEYRGLYIIIETTKNNNLCRLNVSKEDGAIIELDTYWWNEDVYFKTSFFEFGTTPYAYTFKYPDPNDVTETTIDYLTEWINSFEACRSTSGYEKYIDVDSWARWLMTHDLFGTKDGAGSNMFMTKYDMDSTSLIKMGNIWDLDTGEHTPEEWARVHESFYFKDLLESESGLFAKRYKELYAEMSNYFFQKIDQWHIDLRKSDLLKAINLSVKADAMRNPYMALDNAYEACDSSRNWFRNRRKWMDFMLGTMDGIEEHVVKYPRNLPKRTIFGTSVSTNYKGIIIENGIKKIQ